MLPAGFEGFFGAGFLVAFGFAVAFGLAVAFAGAAVAWGFGFSVGSDPPEGPAGSSSAGRAAPGITTAPHFGQQRSPE